MKDLVIIGNGFDLNCGLKSRYSDFFNHKYTSFKKEIFTKNLSDLESNVQEIQKLETNLSRAKFNMRGIKSLITNSSMNYPSSLSSELLDLEANKVEILELENKKKLLEEERFRLINNLMFSKNYSFWDYLFMHLANPADNGELFWSDVEKEILESLNKCKDNKLNSFLTYYVNSKKYSDGQIFTNIDDFLKKNEYDDMFEFLLKELHNFENLFKNYLQEQITDNKSYEGSAHELFKKIVYERNNKNRSIITDKEFYVINFNYTRPFTNIEKRRIIHMNNVHGSLSSDEIIFGIDGFSELPDEFNFFTKTSRIMSLNKTERESIPNKEVIENIFFFGHSFNEADYSYFLSIFDYYDIYNSNIKLCFVYTQHSTNANKLLLKSINALMKRYGSSFDNEAKGKNLMHKLNLENRIIIKEI